MDRDRLIEDHTKLVYFLFHKLRQDNFIKENKDDLISEGFLGLVKAADRFDGSRGFKFTTYAARCISNQMLMYMRRSKKWQGLISLDAPITTDNFGNELFLMDIIEDNSERIDNLIESLAFQSTINTIRGDLSARDKKVLDMRCQNHNQREIAKQLGLNQGNVSKIIRSIKKKYRKLS